MTAQPERLPRLPASPLPSKPVLGGAAGPLDPPTILQLQRTIGNRAVRQVLASQAPDRAQIQQTARAGIAGTGGPLPYQQTIQRAFGKHDVSGIRAHLGDAATQAASAIDAAAFTSGNDIAFAAAPILHTAAHEAAHVVQQRAGVRIEGGVGHAGDAYERHADAVADRVVQGQSCEDLLEPYAGAKAAARWDQYPPVQRKQVEVAGGVFSDEGGDGYIPYYDEPSTGYIARGAQMSELSFTPDKALTNAAGQPAREVSLVQTTNSNIIDEQNPHAPDQPESLLDTRRSPAGSAIDQQIYLSEKLLIGDRLEWDVAEMLDALFGIADKAKAQLTTGSRKPVSDVIGEYVTFFSSGGKWAENPSVAWRIVSGVKVNLENCLAAEGGGIDYRLKAGIQRALRAIEAMAARKKAEKTKINLDPRYTEERGSEGEPLKESMPSGTRAVETHGWSATRPAIRIGSDNEWSGDAILRDRPAHTVEETHTLKGTETFEVAAMADGNKFVGSIRWGWKINGQTPELDPAEIEEVSHGSASEDFMAAANAWNQMEIRDLLDESKVHRPMQLPNTPEGYKPPHIDEGFLAAMEKNQTSFAMRLSLADTTDKSEQAKSFSSLTTLTRLYRNLVALYKLLYDTYQRIAKLDETTRAFIAPSEQIPNFSDTIAAYKKTLHTMIYTLAISRTLPSTNQGALREADEWVSECQNVFLVLQLANRGMPYVLQ